MGYYGPGLDAKPDEAMFIYLHYKLPDWHYITLNDSKLSKSASFKNVINGLYIGQFEELSHLKNGTLIKLFHAVGPYLSSKKLTNVHFIG